MTQRFALPIFYREENSGLWSTGRLPIRIHDRLLYLYTACLCHHGVQKLFDVPDDAFMLQFYVTSKKLKTESSYRVTINDKGWFCFAKEIEPYIYDSVINEFGLALRNHGHVVWYVSCFYWVVE